MAEVERVEVGGREHLRISSDQIQIECVPGLGGTVVSLQRVGSGTELLWRPPWGLRPLSAAPVPGSIDSTSTDSLLGGWQTVFPNGSEAAVVDGADWPAHGEARLAWFDWEQTASSVLLVGRLLRSPFQLTKIISVRDDEVTIGETVKNVGAEHVDVVWGSRLLLGEAMLGPRTRFDTRATLVRPDARQTPSAGYDDILPWPRSYSADGLVNLRSVPPAGHGVNRTAYLSEFLTPQATVSNPDAGVSIDLSWDGDVWPYLWYELESGGRSGYPWWGAERFLALTPSTSWPATSIDEIRRISATSVRIQPGSARTSHLALRVRPG